MLKTAKVTFSFTRGHWQ